MPPPTENGPPKARLRLNTQRRAIEGEASVYKPPASVAELSSKRQSSTRAADSSMWYTPPPKLARLLRNSQCVIVGAPPVVPGDGLQWVVRPPTGRFAAGVVFVDAAGYEPLEPLLTRVGWGAVQLDGDGVVTVMAIGRLGHQLQEVGMAEVRVAGIAAAHAELPITLVTDYLGLRTGSLTGTAATPAARPSMPRPGGMCGAR